MSIRIVACPPHREVVLVVDDEPLVLATVCAILAHAGFEVLRASSAEEALHVGAAHTGAIHVMLSDVVMPGVSGPTLAERFRPLHPETGVLFMAGFAQHPEVVERIVARGLPLLPKPFLPRELTDRIREVLSTSGRRASAAAR